MCSVRVEESVSHSNTKLWYTVPVQSMPSTVETCFFVLRCDIASMHLTIIVQCSCSKYAIHCGNLLLCVTMRYCKHAFNNYSTVFLFKVCHPLWKLASLCYKCDIASMNLLQTRIYYEHGCITSTNVIYCKHEFITSTNV